MLSASPCSLQSRLFPKFALELVLCSYYFNSVVLFNIVLLFALLKETEREGVWCVLFFFFTMLTHRWRFWCILRSGIS